MGKVFVVTPGLALLGLMLFAEVTPARFISHECVLDHGFGKLHIIGNPSGSLQRLIQFPR